MAEEEVDVLDELSMLEKPFYYTGLTTPVRRFVAGNVIVGGLLWYMKPSFAFSNGSPRPWALTSSAGDSTWVPWWTYGLFVGAAISLYI